VVDGPEQTDQGQADGNAERAGGEPCQDGGETAPDIEDHHHVLGAPAVAEPARRERANAIKNGSRHSQRKELAVAQAELSLQRENESRVEQHQEVAEEMPHVREVLGEMAALECHELHAIVLGVAGASSVRAGSQPKTVRPPYS
jgi:hypothetical protein